MTAITSPSDGELPPSRLFGNITSEGIWFVIQNRADLESGPVNVQSNALTWDSSQSNLEMKLIPSDGDYDNFLWRFDSGTRRLINKRTGIISPDLIASSDSTTVDLCGSNSFLIKRTGGSKASQFVELTADQRRKTDASDDPFHTLETFFAEHDWFLTNDNNMNPSLEAKRDRSNQNFIQQVWIAQPMELVSGYEIAAPPADEDMSPFTKKIDAGHGVVIYGTPTASNWAMLNTSLIIWNMLQAIQVGKLNPEPNHKPVQFNCKVLVISDSDVSLVISDSDRSNASNIAQCSILKPIVFPDQIRRGLTNWTAVPGPGWVMIAYESQMGHKGSVSLDPTDAETIRGFKPLLESFGAIIGEVIPFSDQDVAAIDPPVPTDPLKRAEWFKEPAAWWFLSLSLDGSVESFLKTVFTASYYYIVPHMLRNVHT